MENGMNYLWFHQQNNMQGGDGLYGRLAFAQYQYQGLRDTVDPDLEHKTKKVADKVSENLNVIANEPSLAFFRIQEHVRKTLPQLVEQKHEIQEVHQQVQGACFDTEYATNAVKSMHSSAMHFQNIQDLLKNAMFMKQQIEYEDSRKKQDTRQRSMYTSGREEGQGVTMATSMTESSDSSMGHSSLMQSSESCSPGEPGPRPVRSLNIQEHPVFVDEGVEAEEQEIVAAFDNPSSPEEGNDDHPIIRRPIAVRAPVSEPAGSNPLANEAVGVPPGSEGEITGVQPASDESVDRLQAACESVSGLQASNKPGGHLQSSSESAGDQAASKWASNQQRSLAESAFHQPDEPQPGGGQGEEQQAS